jgi:hypothetical protein
MCKYRRALLTRTSIALAKVATCWSQLCPLPPELPASDGCSDSFEERSTRYNSSISRHVQWNNGTTTIIGQNYSISQHVQWANETMGQQSSESCTRVPVTTIQSVAMYNETRENHPDNKTIRTTKSSDNNHHRTTTMKDNNHEGQPPSSDNNHNRGHSPPCPATPRFLAKRN